MLAVSVLGGSALAVLMHSPDDRQRQESAYHLLTRFFEADQARRAALEAANVAPGERLIYTTLTGNVEANIAGVSLPAHPDGGFVLRGADRTGVVWRSPKLPLQPETSYRAVFDITPLIDVPMTVQIVSLDGRELASAPVGMATRSLAVALVGSSQPAFATIAIANQEGDGDIIWIREFRFVEVSN